jgi:WD40 repeat protein
VGSYSDGQPAYRLDYDVRMAQWPDGKILNLTKNFPGENPPANKFWSGAGYGYSPDISLKQWVLSILQDKSILGNRRILTCPNWVDTVAFAPDGKILAAGIQGPLVKIWDVATGQEMRTFKVEGYQQNCSVSFSPDGRILATLARFLDLWDVSTGKLIRNLKEYNITAFTFYPDGKSLAFVSQATVKLWDIAKAQEIRTLVVEEAHITSIAFSPDGKTLACAVRSKGITLWDVTKMRKVRTIYDDTRIIDHMAFSPDGKILANMENLLDVTTGKQICILPRNGTVAWGHAFSPDGKILALATNDGSVKFWDVTKGRVVRTLDGHMGIVHSVAFSPDGNTLASGSYDGTVVLWGLQ